MNAALSDVVSFLNETLALDKVADFPGAWNGLQLANDGEVRRIVAAVDASCDVLARAGSESGTLLIVHHGLFWGEIRPITGRNYEKFAGAIASKLAVYAAHLPLDLHPELGNNAQLMRALNLAPCGTFFREFEREIGLVAETDIELNDLVRRVEVAVGGVVRVLRCGPPRAWRIGVVTGGGGGGIAKAAAAGIDTFITGEGPHYTFAMAQELNVNVIYAGHYATEVFGVKAAAAAVSERFGIPWSFIDAPSGL